MKRQKPVSTDAPGRTQRILRLLVSAILVVLFVAMVVFLIYVDRVLKDEHVPLHVSFLGESLGGMKNAQAVRRIRDIASALTVRPLYIQHGERVWKLQPDQQIDFRVEQESVVERLRRIGNTGSLLSRLRERLRLHTGRDRIELGARFFYHKEKLHRFAELLALNLSRAAEPARVVEEAPWKRLLRETPGVDVSSRDLVRQILAALERVDSYRTADLSLTLAAKMADPDFAAKLRQIGCQEVCRVEVPLSPDAGRQERIRQGVQRLDGLILTGSERFSLNELLAPVKGPALNDEDRREGFFPDPYGLGRLSTALYQAAVLSGMDVLERHAHAHVDLEHRYTEAGRDAAFDFASRDLKLRNRRQTNTILAAEIVGGKLRLVVHASQALPGSIDFVSRNFQQTDCPENIFLDASLPRGQRELIRPGLSGVEVDTDRRLRRSDAPEELLPLSHDEYAPLPKDVRVGDKTP